MQSSRVMMGLFALVTLAYSASTGVTPIQKVIEMLNGMHTTGEKEKHEEQVRMASFNQWCESTTKERERSIQDAADAIVQLEADITAAEAQADELGRDIEELDGNIVTWTGESNKAKSVRDEEHAVFAATHQDYTESLDAIGRAIQVLKARKADVPGQAAAQSLLSVSALGRILPAAAHAKLQTALLQMASAEESSAPEANAYEFQSEGVVGMLEKLQARFKTEEEALTKDEMNRKAAYNLLSQRLTDDINNAEDVKENKIQSKAKAHQAAAEGKANLADTQEGKKTDEEYLSDTDASCKQRNADFEKRQTLRQEELDAIRKAVEIISSPEVSGAAETHLPTALLLQKSAPALALLRRNGESNDQLPRLEKAAALLSAAATRTNSQLLSEIASRASEDPFVKVTKMIKDLLVKLMEEANAEADHHEWCTHELATNKKTRDEKSAGVDDLTSQVEELTALEAKLAQEIADLTEQVALVMKALAEATEVRAVEKEKNAATISDAKSAQAAVARALVILKEFYAKSADATSFAQRGPSEQDQPFVFDDAYTGQQGSKKGVVGMLEVIESDFARLESETVASENEAVSAYKKFAEDSDIERVTKEREARHKGFAKTRAVRDLNQAKKDLKITQEELDAALHYYERLRPSCVDSGRSYEERVKMREEEIQSLKEALNILSGEDFA